jgi:hypothetical protein
LRNLLDFRETLLQLLDLLLILLTNTNPLLA